jgi:hypothetical protein
MKGKVRSIKTYDVVLLFFFRVLVAGQAYSAHGMSKLQQMSAALAKQISHFYARFKDPIAAESLLVVMLSQRGEYRRARTIWE